MLVQIDRHTEEDIILWDEYFIIDKLYYEMHYKRLQQKEEKTINNIINFAIDKNCYYGISWGKDSTVLSHLIFRSQIDLTGVHLYCHPSHNPYCDLVRDQFLDKFGINYCEINVDYSDIYKQNLPDTLQDKLTDKRFYDGFKKAEQLFGPKHISGIRSEESGKRRIRSQTYGINTNNTSAPLSYWTNQEIFAYLSYYDLPIHPNYAMLGSGLFKRDKIRVAEIGDISGNGVGRRLWEEQYYGDILRKIYSR